ncbi:hypothetical protein [Nocardia cyriacigeorgica]|uniref:hypothetical protein n=1 Tax=Nocardia cyriacigeorgica TaxID=135487 RepID=UPI00189594A8|nr:hypothetical protein [Nocardia cyriacigeorgica]MBF6455243.1 hypothetical protein [Nocardia cyriacigeorgica]MBF6554015.1 hypothetical protein [Nocardia cyriacigeorgica]
MLSIALVSVGLIPMIGLTIGGYLGFVRGPMSPYLALAFLPGWFPGLLMIAYVIHERSTRYAEVQPILSETDIVVRAHPAFAAAVEAMPKQ